MGARAGHFPLRLLFAIVCGLVCMAYGQPPTLRIPRVSRPPRLEHFLNGWPREAEARVADFRQRDPGDGVPASRETTAYLAYDDENFYVVFVCKEEPEQVRARLAEREHIFSDDLVGVTLDTFHDQQRAYLFLSNPLGVQLDGIVTEGQGSDFGFDTLWYSEGQLTPEGFVVWMAIPFKSLRFPNSGRQTWGIALQRRIRGNSESCYWPFITRRVAGFLQQMATLEGLDRISPGRNVQFIPYGAFTRARFLDTAVPRGPLFRAENDARIGLDAKAVFRDALTLDVTLNPDFSHVESNEPQVTVNRRFEVFFPEKRPFFMENAGYFETQESLFFSRRIVDPQSGLRLTGKVGSWAVGALAADDRAPGMQVPENDPLYGRQAGIGILRVRREFGDQSYVGVLTTSRDFASSSNRVFSADTRLKLNPNWILDGQLMRSYTRELDGEHLSGPAYSARLSHWGRHFGYSGRYSDFSPDFRTQLGFIRRVDIRRTRHFARYRWRPERGKVLSFGPLVGGMANWDRQGRLQDWFVTGRFEVNLRGTEFEVRRSDSFELFEGLGFRKHFTAVSFYTERHKRLTVSAAYHQGAGVNFFPASGLQPFSANSSRGLVKLTWRPKPRFRFQQTYIYSRLGTHQNSLPTGAPVGTAIFNNHLVRWKLYHQFTRELSLRAILDYRAVLPNPTLVALEREKLVTVDILFTYMLHPGKALYIGYTDRYENLALDPTVQPTLQRTVSPFNPTGRQFFVKMSYLFRF